MRLLLLLLQPTLYPVSLSVDAPAVCAIRELESFLICLGNQCNIQIPRLKGGTIGTRILRRSLDKRVVPS